MKICDLQLELKKTQKQEINDNMPCHNNKTVIIIIIIIIIIMCGLGSSVSIATDYSLHSLGIESRWGRDFPPVQTGPGAHPASCKMGTGPFPGVKCGRGMLLTAHPPSSAMVMEE